MRRKAYVLSPALNCTLSGTPSCTLSCTPSCTLSCTLSTVEGAVEGCFAVTGRFDFTAFRSARLTRAP